MKVEAAVILKAIITFQESSITLYLPDVYYLHRTSKGNLIWKKNKEEVAHPFTSYEAARGSLYDRGIILLNRCNKRAKFFRFKESDLCTV